MVLGATNPFPKVYCSYSNKLIIYWRSNFLPDIVAHIQYQINEQFIQSTTKPVSLMRLKCCLPLHVESMYLLFPSLVNCNLLVTSWPLLYKTVARATTSEITTRTTTALIRVRYRSMLVLLFHHVGFLEQKPGFNSYTPEKSRDQAFYWYFMTLWVNSTWNTYHYHPNDSRNQNGFLWNAPGIRVKRDKDSLVVLETRLFVALLPIAGHIRTPSSVLRGVCKSLIDFFQLIRAQTDWWK